MSASTQFGSIDRQGAPYSPIAAAIGWASKAASGRKGKEVGPSVRCHRRHEGEDRQTLAINSVPSSIQ